MSQLLTGTFSDPALANAAVDRVIALGYARDEISVLMSGETRHRYFGSAADETDAGANIAKGAAGGGMIGGTIGAIVAAVALTGSIGVTVATGGVAAPFVAGPLAAALLGGGAGAAAGSVIGAVAGAGVSGEHARTVEHDIELGKIVVALNARDEDVPAVRDILSGAALVASTGQPAVAASYEPASLRRTPTV